MEAPYSHSRPPAFSSKKKPPPFLSSSSSSSSSTFNNSSTNNGGFFTTSYDDVFGGPPKFTSSSLAPRPEDYSEIFGGFRLSSSSSSSSSLRSSSSIPVLDLPAIPDDIHSVASALFDYSEVFGGFSAVDFAVPFDQLFRPCHGDFCDGDGDVDDDDDQLGHGSSDEAWTPVGTESLSDDDSDPFASSEKSQCFSSENSHQQLESKQFNVSYHKVNPGTSTYTPNTTHVTQLNDLPVYTCVVEEATTLRETGKETFSPVVDDIVFDVASPSDVSHKHTRKTMSHASYDNTGLKSYDSDHRSKVNSSFTSVSNNHLKTEPSHVPVPSRPPPVVLDRNGGIDVHSSGPVASEQCGLEGTVDGKLPSFFNMEVDASSSAAASAAAMKDVMDKAQAKLKAAKESRDRKDRVQNKGKLHLETDIKGGENVVGARDECLSGDLRTQATTDGGPSKVNNSVKVRHAKSASQNLPDVLAGEQPSGASGDFRAQATTDGGPSKVKVSGKARHAKSASHNLPDTMAGEQPYGKSGETKQGKKSSLSVDTNFTDAGGQWKEARQYYEFVNDDNTSIGTQPPSSNGDAKTVTKLQGGEEDNYESAEEAFVAGDNRRRLKAPKSVSRQEYYEKMVKVAQEVHDSAVFGHMEPDKRSKSMSKGNPRQQRPEMLYDPEWNKISLSKSQKVEETSEDVIMKGVGMRSNNLFEKEQSKQQSEACYIEQVETNDEDPQVSIIQEPSEVREAEMRESCQRDKGDDTMRETIARDGCEQRIEESCGRQWTESRVAETGGVAGKGLKQPFEDVLSGDEIQTACEINEMDHPKDLQQTEAANERLKENFEIVSATERLQRACKSLEDNKIQNLHQSNENENDLDAEVGGQRSKKKPGNFAELEKFQGYQEAEQAMRRQRTHEVSNHVFDNQNSNKDLGQNAMNKNVELEETMKKDSNSKEELRGPNRSHIETEWDEEEPMFDSSPDIELSTEVKHHVSSDGGNLCGKEVELDMCCNLKKPQKTTNGFVEVTADKQNGEIDTRTSYNNSKFEAVEIADVLIDESHRDPNATQVGSNDIDDLQGRTVKAPNKLEPKEINTMTGSACPSNEQTLKEEKKVAQLDSDPSVVKDTDVEGGEKRNLMGEDRVHGDHADKVRPTLGEGNNKSTSKEAAAHSVLPEDKDSFQKNSHQLNLGQSIERKGKIIDHSSSEKKVEDKERDLEKERLQKLEEERERLREREKDRMAVELAVREARDRAFADARDRAERVALEKATDEARQRAMAEARERLEKACAEARERSLADKASEARLRAERAAVERANAEARQRAIEKTMADRANFEARERMQRSVSEKYLSERDVIMRQSSFPTSSERYESSYGEPVQRCKARLERHRRTVERVANALAEKNMRDLLAQREQAERTRLAETLDAEIRRWSSGKEGNLRALLSTLQYILGPDSGWQPIPLTEVITAVAVKKAYRKATLCVHPDKLQQRGASIQQKYICEKVFDLLKEAWNRFNSEEK